MGSEMAGLISPPTEHVNLWNSKSEIHLQFKCSCFVKGDMWPSRDTLWRLGPEFSFSTPLLGKQCRNFLVIGLQTRFHAKRSPARMLGLEDAYAPLRPFILPKGRVVSCLTDYDKMLKCFKSDTSESEQLLSDRNDKDHPIEEPWLLHSSLCSQYAAHSDASTGWTNEDRILLNRNSDLLVKNSCNQSVLEVKPCSKSEDVLSSIDKGLDQNATFSRRDEPVEEPWLFESCLLLGSNSKVVCDKESDKDEVTRYESFDQHHQVTEKLLPEEASVISQEDSVSTQILINSSVCTMQRTAVLEEGKLVEILLEPVKNKVECRSVYLGVVSILVPDMGGAFVNIGGPRKSFLQINPSRKPFIFPPFCQSTKEVVYGPAFSIPEEQPGVNETQNKFHNVETGDEIEEGEITNDSVPYMHDEYAEHDIEDDFDIQEVLRENVNGSLPSLSEVKADLDGCPDQLDGSMHNAKGCSENSPPPPWPDFMKDFKDECTEENKWAQVRQGTKIIVQVVKEGIGSKGPTVTAYPTLKSRFWVLLTRWHLAGVSRKITDATEKTRLTDIARRLQPQGFGLIARTVAAGRSSEELQKDLEGSLSTWKDIMERAKSAALAADEGFKGAIPVLLHKAMGQTLSLVQDFFNEKVKSMVVDSPTTYNEVTNYLQDIAPDLSARVELYNRRTPLFDEYDIEKEIDNILNKSVPLANGGYLVIEQTEALVSIDVNGGHRVLGRGTSQENAALDVNLAAAKQIAKELRLRDIGGIIVVDFLKMADDANKRQVYEVVKKAVERDRSTVKVYELSREGLMEIIRERVRPSVTFMISEPCSCCHATGRVEALETSFSKIEREICRLLAKMDKKPDPENPKSWPVFILWVDRYMSTYLTSGKISRLSVLKSSLKVLIVLKIERELRRGEFKLLDNSSEHEAATSIRSRNAQTVYPMKRWKSTR